MGKVDRALSAVFGLRDGTAIIASTRRAFLTAAGAGLAAPSLAQGQAWPNRTVRLISPFPPGGPQDIPARFMAEFLTPRLGQPVVYEHRAGAGVSLGAQHLAQATDHHSFLVTSSSITTLPAMRRNPELDLLTDLQPVTLVTDTPMLLLGRSNGPADFVRFLALARTNPGKVSWGSSGVGTATHLAGALLMQRAGIRLEHVPYRGATLAMNALLAGDIDSIISEGPIPLEHLRAGTLRPLGVTGSLRAPLLSNVPAIIEHVPRYSVTSWLALMAPKAMPAEPVARLLAELAPLAAPDSALFRRMDERGSELLLNGPAPLAARLRQEIPQWRAVVAAAGIQRE